MLTRRSFLAGTVLAEGTVFAAPCVWRVAAAEPQELRIPELIDARSQGQSIALINSGLEGGRFGIENFGCRRTSI